MRLQGQRKRGARRTPRSILIGCLHFEPVAPWRNVRVVSGAAQSGMNPALIESRQLVSKVNPASRTEIWCRKVKFEIAGSRLYAQTGPDWKLLFVRDHVLDQSQLLPGAGS